MCVTYYYVVSSLRQVFAQPESHSQYVLAKKYQAPVMTDDFNKAVLSCRCEKNRCRMVWRFRDINSRHRHLSKTAIAILVLSILAACVSDVRSYIRWMFFSVPHVCARWRRSIVWLFADGATLGTAIRHSVHRLTRPQVPATSPTTILPEYELHDRRRFEFWPKNLRALALCATIN